MTSDARKTTADIQKENISSFKNCVRHTSNARKRSADSQKENTSSFLKTAYVIKV
jgi:hypothetical protein